MKSDKTYIAVMDYRNGTINMYTIPNKEIQSLAETSKDLYENPVEDWLYNNTDFDSNCSYMSSDKPIKVIQK